MTPILIWRLPFPVNTSLIKIFLRALSSMVRIRSKRRSLSLSRLLAGGIDSPSLNAIDPVLGQHVHITKYLCFKSKSSTQQYVNHLYERILVTSRLSHPNVRRIISWYIADGCLYSITGLIRCTLRHAIQSERFAIERIQRLSSQIIQGTIYLQSNSLCPLTPW
jgi:hypothetical protein